IRLVVSTGRVASFGRDPSSDGRVTGGKVANISVRYLYERRDEDASRRLYGSVAHLGREAPHALARATGIARVNEGGAWNSESRESGN
ncbi:unnamed protein product, partial [Ascophyllum nodosum]